MQENSVIQKYWITADDRKSVVPHNTNIKLFIARFVWLSVYSTRQIKEVIFVVFEFVGNGRNYSIWLAISFAIAFTFFLIMFFVHKKLKKLPEEKASKVKLWILRGLCIFLLLLEAYKFYVVISWYGFITHWIFPLQICSLPLFLFPFTVFAGENNPIRKFALPASFAIGIVGGILTIVYPSGVFAPEAAWFMGHNYLSLQTISLLFHTVMYIFAIYMLISKVYTPKLSDALRTICVFLFFAVIALFLNFNIQAGDILADGQLRGESANFMMLNITGLPLDALKGISEVLFIVVCLITFGLALVLPFFIFELFKAIKTKRQKKLNN